MAALGPQSIFMIRLRKTLPLAAALVLVLPSCVIALGNRGASPHPHEDCPICSEHMESGGEHASAVGPTPSHYEHVLVGEEPVLATSR